jgi:hypothetical protein
MCPHALAIPVHYGCETHKQISIRERLILRTKGSSKRLRNRGHWLFSGEAMPLEQG